MDIPNKDTLADEGDEDGDKNVEENGLVVQDSDGLGCRADGTEPVELAHRL